MVFDFLLNADLPLKEFVYICILTFLFAFLSFVGSRRIEPAGIQGGAWLFITYYGFPLQFLKVLTWRTEGGPYEGEVVMTEGMSRMNIAWSALILDFVLHFLLAFVIVYGITKLTDR